MDVLNKTLFTTTSRAFLGLSTRVRVRCMQTVPSRTKPFRTIENTPHQKNEPHLSTCSIQLFSQLSTSLLPTLHNAPAAVPLITWWPLSCTIFSSGSHHRFGLTGPSQTIFLLLNPSLCPKDCAVLSGQGLSHGLYPCNRKVETLLDP